MFTYDIRTGNLSHGGDTLGFGFSGHPPHTNDPASTNLPNIGPIPQGTYLIGPSYHHPVLGPVTMNLSPDESNQMFGRSAFRIHGASALHPEDSSEGCIILPRGIRELISSLSDRVLEVV